MVVSAYLITVIGVPVYLHYCGGELETINYLVKADSCCGGEEEDTSDNGCCEDEGLVLKSNVDFTIKDKDNFNIVDLFPTFSFITLPYLQSTISQPLFIVKKQEPPPPKLQEKIVSISVLRI